jgi:hypothetical protein
MSLWFSNIASASEQQFIENYSKTELYTNEYLQAYYAWFHSNASWEKVVEAFSKTKACQDHYPDLYNKYNSHSPPT